jgi:hypothetical protein
MGLDGAYKHLGLEMEGTLITVAMTMRGTSLVSCVVCSRK